MLSHWEISTTVQYATQSYYPDTKRTSPCFILLILSAWLGSDKYQVWNHWFDSTGSRTPDLIRFSRMAGTFTLFPWCTRRSCQIGAYVMKNAWYNKHCVLLIYTMFCTSTGDQCSFPLWKACATLRWLCVWRDFWSDKTFAFGPIASSSTSDTNLVWKLFNLHGVGRS